MICYNCRTQSVILVYHFSGIFWISIIQMVLAVVIPIRMSNFWVYSMTKWTTSLWKTKVHKSQRKKLTLNWLCWRFGLEVERDSSYPFKTLKTVPMYFRFMLLKMTDCGSATRLIWIEKWSMSSRTSIPNKYIKNKIVHKEFCYEYIVVVYIGVYHLLSKKFGLWNNV